MIVLRAFASLNEVVVQIDRHEDCCGSGTCQKPTDRRYETDVSDVENYGSEAEQALWLALRGIRKWDRATQEGALRG